MEINYNNANDPSDIINNIKEIDDKLKDTKDGKKRTKLMFEQMLRGLYLSQGIV